MPRNWEVRKEIVDAQVSEFEEKNGEANVRVVVVSQSFRKMAEEVCRGERVEDKVVPSESLLTRVGGQSGEAYSCAGVFHGSRVGVHLVDIRRYLTSTADEIAGRIFSIKSLGSGTPENLDDVNVRALHNIWFRDINELERIVRYYHYFMRRGETGEGGAPDPVVNLRPNQDDVYYTVVLNEVLLSPVYVENARELVGYFERYGSGRLSAHFQYKQLYEAVRLRKEDKFVIWNVAGVDVGDEYVELSEAQKDDLLIEEMEVPYYLHARSADTSSRNCIDNDGHFYIGDFNVLGTMGGTCADPRHTTSPPGNAKQLGSGQRVIMAGQHMSQAIFHWLVESMTRIAHVTHTFEESESLTTRIWTGPNDGAIGVHSVMFMGFDRQKQLLGGAVCAPDMVVPVYSRCGYPSPFSLAAIRKLLRANAEPPKDSGYVLVIDRSGSRRPFAAHAALMSQLDSASLSVKTMKMPAETANIFSLFAGAKCVVGPHGAGLANVLVSSPGIHVFEIFPVQYEINLCFAFLSRERNLHHHIFVVDEGKSFDTIQNLVQSIKHYC